MKNKDTLNKNIQLQKMHEARKCEVENTRKALECGFYTIDDLENKNDALGFAVSYDNFKLAQLLLEHNADPNTVDEESEQTLIFFARTPEIIKLLIKYGARVNIKNIFGKTPLSVYTCRKEKNLIETILQFGADPNIADNEKNTPLITAVHLKEPEIVKILLEFSADQKINNIACETALFFASDNESIELLLKNGANINDTDENGATPLLINMIKDEKEIVKILLENGADPNIQDLDGNSTLIIAVSRRKTKIIKMLLEYKADTEIVNKKGKTAIFYSGKPNIINMLIKSGANINKQDLNNATPLTKATRYEEIETITTLLRHGANPNIKQDPIQYSALMIAIIKTNNEIAEILIKNGADIELKNKEGQTALIMAAFFGKIKLTKILLKSGANINAQDKNGDTALILAVFFERNTIVQILLEHGADKTIKNNFGRTAIDYAKDMEHEKIIKLLEKQK